MKKDITWLKKEIGTEMIELEPIRRERWADVKYQTLRSISQKIYQLDEPEVLSHEWIEDNTFVVTDEDGDDYAVVENRKLKDKLVPKQELPVIPKYIAEYIDLVKIDIPLMKILAVANRRNELPEWKKEYDWISANDEMFARAWLNGYTVADEPLYYAMVKGHELLYDTAKYWAHNKYDSEDLFISYNTRDDSPIIVKNTKNHWVDLGINDSNADFVKVV